MLNDTTNIYWSVPPADDDMNWGILYPDPMSLYNELRPKMTKSEPHRNMFYCPAVKVLTSNTFVFKNPMDADYYIDELGTIKSNLTNGIRSKIEHPPSIDNSILFRYGLQYIFFAEDDDIEVTVTSPYFDTPNHLIYGNLVPGRFSISNWFRSVNVEFNLKPGVRNLKIEKDEPILYVTFNTNKKINLIRFDMNKSLFSIQKTCSSAANWESWVPLAARYKRFKESRMKDSILREIKSNIVGHTK
jgi:hypothetical protein